MIQELILRLERLETALARESRPYIERIALIQRELEDATAELERQCTELREQIKAMVIEGQTSVKGDSIFAIYVKPRVTWDSKRLEGYAAAHPEIEAFKKVGRPSVRFQNVR